MATSLFSRGGGTPLRRWLISTFYFLIYSCAIIPVIIFVMHFVSALANSSFLSNLGPFAEYLVFVLILIVWFLVGRLTYRIIEIIVKKASKKAQTKVSYVFLDVIEEPLVLFIFILGFWMGFKELSIATGEVAEVAFLYEISGLL